MFDLEWLEHAETPIGTIYLGRRRSELQDEWVYEIQISGRLLMSSLHNVSERQLSTTALSLHGGEGPLKVLVGGLGLGYTAEAALRSPSVASVRVVEKMDFVIDWMNRGLLPLSEEFAADERLEIVQGDVYEQLLGPTAERYDLILVDVDHGPADRLADGIGRFYTVQGQQAVAQHLAPGGVLAVWSAFDDEEFAVVLDEVHPRSCREEASWDDSEDPGVVIRDVLFFGGGAPASP
jgi:spermidine synthase